MNLEEYQEWTRTTGKYPKKDSLSYLVMGLAGEAGEVANKYKKIIRDKSGILEDSDIVEIGSELGDVLWYVTRLCDELDLWVDDVIADNYHKLESRLRRGKIGGSGDDR